MGKVAEIQNRTSGFVDIMGEMLSAVETNGEELFSQLAEMDGAHTEVKGLISENFQHMQNVFDALSSVWESASDHIQQLQEHDRDNFEQNIKQLSETKHSEQQELQNHFTNSLSDGFNELVNGELQPHINNLAEALTGNLIPNVQSLIEGNKALQEDEGAAFSQMRTEALDRMFGGAENLYNAVEGVMDVMTNTVEVTSTVADVTVQAMDQTNIGLNQLNDAVENLLSLLGGLSLD